MEFGNPSLSLLSKNTKQESETFIESVTKLTTIYDMTKTLYGINSKYILLGGSKMILTSQMHSIFSNIPPSHPILRILNDYINKMNNLGDGCTFMVNLSCVLIKNIAILLQKGMKKQSINNLLDEIKRKIVNLEYETSEVELNSSENIQKVFKGVLKNDELLRVFTEAILIVNNEKELDDRIRIVKISTGSLDESYAIQGMIFKGEPVTNTKELVYVNTSIFNCPIEVSKTVTKGTVVFEKAEELLNFSSNEQIEIKKLANKISKNSGLLICNGKVENCFIDYLNESKTVAFSIYSKHDIRRIRNLLNGCISPVLREVKENGFCERISVFEDCNTKYTKFEGKGKVSTIVLKNSISFLLDEYERIIQKAITLIIKNKQSKFVLVNGSGKFEEEVCLKLKEDMSGDEDYAPLVYKAFCDSLREVAVKENNEGIFDILEIKSKAIKYAIEICSIVLTTEDYYYVRTNDMGIKPRGPGSRD